MKQGRRSSSHAPILTAQKHTQRFSPPERPAALAAARSWPRRSCAAECSSARQRSSATCQALLGVSEIRGTLGYLTGAKGILLFGDL